MTTVNLGSIDQTSVKNFGKNNNLGEISEQ